MYPYGTWSHPLYSGALFREGEVFTGCPCRPHQPAQEQLSCQSKATHLCAGDVWCHGRPLPVCHQHIPWAAYNAILTRVHQLQMLTFSHGKLLVWFGFMLQAVTGACITLLQPMQRGIYQKPLMTSVPHDHSYLKQNKTRIKKMGEGGEWSQVRGAVQTAYAHWFMKCDPILNHHHRPLTHGSWWR